MVGSSTGPRSAALVSPVGNAKLDYTFFYTFFCGMFKTSQQCTDAANCT